MEHNLLREFRIPSSPMKNRRGPDWNETDPLATTKSLWVYCFLSFHSGLSRPQLHAANKALGESRTASSRPIAGDLLVHALGVLYIWAAWNALLVLRGRSHCSTKAWNLWSTPGGLGVWLDRTMGSVRHGSMKFKMKGGASSFVEVPFLTTRKGKRGRDTAAVVNKHASQTG